MSKRPSYSREFKLEAVRLLKSGEKPAADVARGAAMGSGLVLKQHRPWIHGYRS